MGKELAQLFYDAGWTVGIAARRIDCLNKWREENLRRNFSASDDSQAREPAIHTAQIDVCSDDAPAQLLDLIERMGGVDLYLHVSGVGKINQELQEDIELNTVNTNGMGFVRMVGTAYRYMAVHGGGHIAVISSIAGTKGLGRHRHTVQPNPCKTFTFSHLSNWPILVNSTSNLRILGQVL